MAVNDDEIIKRRLLYEGDGGNDDKRINSLLKTFIRWCHSSESQQENALGLERMMASLMQCEHTMEKSMLVHTMNTREQDNYNKLSQEIEAKIQDATEKIAECKNELSQAKRIRKNRQEYDALARVIQQHPDRQETMKQLQGLDKDVSSLEEQKKSLEEKLDLRRKQFHVLIAAIHELENILDEDEAKEGGAEEMDTN
ncbi:THO complex subunit 7 homolog [Ostrea edulis]|uniref:THO complex subunit 7 homolog n=1 Tax=Ostrea edulis TaxID=37623 RepID=UPI002095D03F|nr:THO complex subunit 7 homolog [Ostrea edulis]